MTDTATRLTAALADRYLIERELGEGGMATVYLAEDVKHHRRVAIKVLHAALSAVLGPERFLAEIQLTANLQHPHILPLFDSGDADGLLFYVMPFVDGETLRGRLERERQLPIAEAVQVAREVADALGHAHQRGVIHRDIKPENILLLGGHALVADFGIALAVEQAGGKRMTQTGMSIGTPQYMSPEQAMGDKTVDLRADVYALGAVTYEMLAGEPPFTGPSAQAIVARVMTEDPRPLRQARRNVPEAVDAAVLTALEKLPADRFATAAEFGAALTRADGHPSLMRAGGSVTGRPRADVGPPLLRNPVVLALALLALAASAFGFREWRSSRHSLPPDVVRFTVNLPPGYRPNLLSNQGPDLAIARDGGMLAFPVTNPQGARELFVRRMDEAEGRVLPGTDGAYVPAFSADGTALVYWAAGRLQRVRLGGGAPQVVGEVGLGQSIAVLDDGDIVLQTLAGRPLLRMPAAGGVAVPVAPLDSARGEANQFFPLPLPGGTHVLYASWGEGGIDDVHIGLVDLSRGVAQRLDVQGTYPLGMVDGNLVYADQTGTILTVQLDLESGHATGSPVTLGTGMTISGRGSAVAALSPAGTLVYLGGSQASSLVLANASGEHPLPTGAGLLGYPRYSPDGRQVALAIASGTASDVWIADVASGALTRLTSGGSVNERPEWSPDGSRVLFRTARGAGSALWWQPANGSGPATPLLASDSSNYFEGVLTPDGQHLVYQEDKGESNVLMQRLGSDDPPIEIARTPASESQPRVSPDGKWVVYASGESGTAQVMVEPLFGEGSRVQVSIRGGNEPVWSRDGRRIYYRAEGKFKVAEVSYSPTFHVTERADFMDDVYVASQSPHANYDVSPDGRSLLVLKGESPRLQVVHNWGSEVRAKLADGTRNR